MVVQVFMWFSSHKGDLYWFIGIVAFMGQYTVKPFFVLTTLEFSPNDNYQLLSGIQFQSEASIGNHSLSALLPDLSPLKVEILD